MDNAAWNWLMLFRKTTIWSIGIPGFAIGGGSMYNRLIKICWRMRFHLEYLTYNISNSPELWDSFLINLQMGGNSYNPKYWIRCVLTDNNETWNLLNEVIGRDCALLESAYGWRPAFVNSSIANTNSYHIFGDNLKVPIDLIGMGNGNVQCRRVGGWEEDAKTWKMSGWMDGCFVGTWIPAGRTFQEVEDCCGAYLSSLEDLLRSCASSIAVLLSWSKWTGHHGATIYIISLSSGNRLDVDGWMDGDVVVMWCICGGLGPLSYWPHK